MKGVDTADIKLKYKTIFIDWNGTLSFSKFWGHLENRKHSDSVIFTKIEKSLFENLRSLLKPWMKGELTSEEVIQIVADDAGLPYKKVFEEFIISCRQMKIASDRALLLINNIRKKKVKVVIATDNMDSFHRWTIPSLHLYDHFDSILNSYNLKAMKNDIDGSGRNLFFQEYLSRHNISAGESILVDDCEDKDCKIENTGISYKKIKPIVGLVPALEEILVLLD